jgi:diguanylate cyclase (GGDEF)-like protein
LPPNERNDAYLDRTAIRSVARATDRGFALGFLVVVASLTLQAVNVALPPETLPPTPVPIAFGVAVVGTLLFGLILMRLRGRVRHGLAAVDHDFTALQDAYDRARLDSLLDALTGLGNHRAFQEELDARIAQARDDDQPLALVMIDVDDLKTINDQKGHAAGDDLLRSVAMIMRANLRRGDGAYRTGGDEFALLLPHCDADGAEVIANHLLASALSGNHGRTGAFSVTIGISSFPDLSADRHQIIHHADAALYAGKRHGRTNVQRFDPARHGIAEDSRSLAQLEAAVVRVAS